jgi:hypothetical protein
MVFQWIDMGIVWEIHGIIFGNQSHYYWVFKNCVQSLLDLVCTAFCRFQLDLWRPIKVNKQWIDVANRPYISHEDINLRVKLRWFRRFVQNMLREGQVQVGYEQCREESSAIRMCRA